MSSETYWLLARAICLRFPNSPVHCRHENPVVPNSIPLAYNAMFFKYVILNGKRYYASRTVGSRRSSLVHIVIPGVTVTHAFGEVLEIFQFSQHFRETDSVLWFARMRWLKPWNGDDEEVWTEL